MKKILFITVTVLLLYSSCKTDFEINAEWKDITVVYGLLSQNDKTQFIKINKAFLGDGNALTMATNPDSCTYPPGTLDVWIEEWLNNSQSRQWTLHDTTIINKDPGTFYYPNQILYTFYADTLYENAEYRLYIKNNTNGKVISSKTPLVHNFSVIQPSDPQAAAFHSPNPYQVKWYSAENGKLYQVTIRFNYWEKIVGASDSTRKSVEWNLGTVKSQGTEGGKVMITDYYGDAFFQYLGNQIQYNANMIRRVAVPNVEFIFSVAADDFNTYMEINAPSTGINQEKPEYTNITNGIGIFSSRFQIIKPHAMHTQSLYSLKNGQYTINLNFQ